MQDRTCVICDTPLTTRQKLACSKPCKMKHYWTTPEGKAAKVRAQRKYEPLKRKPCSDCGTPTVDATCWRCNQRIQQRKQQRKQRRMRAHRKLAIAAKGTTGGFVITMGRCHYCGNDLTSRGSEPARFCSKRCKQLSGQSKKRARGYDVWVEEVNRPAVFDRHGWICHLCGDTIDANLPANDPLSATLDHVIALVARGPHVESNLRPAHMMCNSIKSIEEHGLSLTA